MVKVGLLFREPRKGAYSIEEIFAGLMPRFQSEVEVESFICKGSARLANLLQVRRKWWDLYHITGDVNYLALGLPKKRTILTIHDIGHLSFSLKGIKKTLFKYFWFTLPLRYAAAITTISEFTKQEIVEEFFIDPKKITVIHNPAPFHTFRRCKPTQIQGRECRILQIGNSSHKNAERLIEAVAGIDVELIFVRAPSEKLSRLLKKGSVRHRFVEGLSYKEVFHEYEKADIVFFASLYEGFGMPIVEAQLVGRPVITSKVASMPEIAGKGAHFVNPLNTIEIREGIQKILHSPAYREYLIQQGFENAKRFSVQQIASLYVRLYRSLITS